MANHVAPSRMPLRGILAWFTVWIAASTLYMGWRAVGIVRNGDAANGIFLLGLSTLFAVGVLLILLRHPATRRYWIIVLSLFWLLGAVGLLLGSAPPSVRQVQVSTLAAVAVLIGYWVRSVRVRLTFGRPRNSVSDSPAG